MTRAKVIPYIPERIYVATQRYTMVDDINDHRLHGFAVPYAASDKFKHRKDTADKWAYGTGILVTIDQNEAIVLSDTGLIDPRSKRREPDSFELFATERYPFIFDNVAIEGFVVEEITALTFWDKHPTNYNDGNWWVYDPRGVRLDISGKNLHHLIQSTSIVNGKIRGECIWAAQGRENILVHVGSKMYHDLLSMGDLHNKKDRNGST